MKTRETPFMQDFPDRGRSFLSGYGHGMPLDLEAFRTRIFRHVRQGGEAVAFVAAPAFIWKGGTWKGMASGLPESVSKGPIYTVYGVYSVDAKTLTDWTERRLMRGSVRIFIRLLDALDYVDQVNQALAEEHFEDLQAGRLASVSGWRAAAIDAFRLHPDDPGETGEIFSQHHAVQYFGQTSTIPT